MGCLFGCWIGAFPIALDWDRIWQEWPYTCVVGIFLGKSIFLFFAFPVCYFLGLFIGKDKNL